MVQGPLNIFSTKARETLNFFVRHFVYLSYFGATGTLVLDFWSTHVYSGFRNHKRMHLVDVPCGGKCNVHSLKSTSSATPAQSLDSQLCGATI